MKSYQPRSNASATALSARAVVIDARSAAALRFKQAAWMSLALLSLIAYALGKAG